MGEKGRGTWIPDDAFDKWETLRLDPPAWNVHLVIARQQFRYGGREAHIILSKVAERTELSLSTVKRAVSRLQKEKLLVKLGRGRWQLLGVNMVTPNTLPKGKHKSVNKVIPSEGHDHGPFAILLFSIVKEENDSDDKTPFTDQQIRTLDSVLRQVSELFDGDALELTVPNVVVEQASVTYKSWLRSIVAALDRKGARQFVGAVLKILNDERVIGRELQ